MAPFFVMPFAYVIYGGSASTRLYETADEARVAGIEAVRAARLAMWHLKDYDVPVYARSRQNAGAMVDVVDCTAAPDYHVPEVQLYLRALASGGQFDYSLHRDAHVAYSKRDSFACRKAVLALQGCPGEREQYELALGHYYEAAFEEGRRSVV